MISAWVRCPIFRPPGSAGDHAVMLAIGARKLVPHLKPAHDRIYEHSLKLGNARAQAAYGQHSSARFAASQPAAGDPP